MNKWNDPTIDRINDPKLALEVAQIALFYQGFDKWYEALTYTSPGLQNKIMERMQSAEGNFDQILEWREWVESLMGV